MNAAQAVEPPKDVLLFGASHAAERIKAYRMDAAIRLHSHLSADALPSMRFDAIVFPIDHDVDQPVAQVAALAGRYPDTPIVLVMEPAMLDLAREAMAAGANDTVVLQLLSAQRLTTVLLSNIAMSAQPEPPAVDRSAAQRYRHSWAQLLDSLAAIVAQVSDASTDSQVNQVLRLVGEFANADRSYVFLYDPDSETMTNTHEWCRAKIEPQINELVDVPCDWFPEWMRRFHAGELVILPDVMGIAGNRGREQEMLLAQGIRSVVAVPMRRNGLLSGFVGFDAVRSQRGWNKDEAELLRRTAELLDSALLAKKH